MCATPPTLSTMRKSAGRAPKKSRVSTASIDASGGGSDLIRATKSAMSAAPPRTADQDALRVVQHLAGKPELGRKPPHVRAEADALHAPAHADFHGRQLRLGERPLRMNIHRRDSSKRLAGTQLRSPPILHLAAPVNSDICAPADGCTARPRRSVITSSWKASIACRLGGGRRRHAIKAFSRRDSRGRHLRPRDALAAAKRGKKVVVIDRDAQANGASVRNFGFVTVTGQQRGECWRRAMRSREVWEEIAPKAGIEIVQRGLVVAARRPEARAVLKAFLATEMGKACRLLGPEEARSCFPELNAISAALHSPHELRVESRDAIPKLADWLAEAHGVAFMRGASVHARRAASDRDVTRERSPPMPRSSAPATISSASSPSASRTIG